MSDIRWEDHISGSLRRILDKSEHLQDDVYEGAKLVLSDAQERVPKESGDLAAGGHIERGRGGNGAAAIAFRGPYARWIHEHLFFKHPHGGEAKFLETALLLKGKDAINKAGDHFWRRL